MSRKTRTRSTPSLPVKGGMSNLKFSLIIVVVFVVGVGTLFGISRFNADDTSDAAAVAVRENSLRLSTSRTQAS